MGPYKKQKKETPLSDEALKRFDKEIPQRRSDRFMPRSHSEDADAASEVAEQDPGAASALEASSGEAAPVDPEPNTQESTRLHPSEVPARLRFSDSGDGEVKPRRSSPRKAELRAQAIEEAKAKHETAADRRKAADFRTLHREAVKAQQRGSKWDGNKDGAPNTRRKLPIVGILELLGVLAIVIVGVVVVSKYTQRDSTTVSETGLAKEVPFANIPGQTIENVVESFFQCKSVDEMLGYVRNPEIVEPAMRAWYAIHPMQPTAVELLDSKEGMVSDGVINAPDQLWVTAATIRRLDTLETAPVMVERTQSGFKVDWESTIAISDQEFETFLTERPTTAAEFRVMISQDDYSFEDETQWTCYRVLSQKAGVSCFGYTVRGGAVEAKLKGWFYPGETSIPIIAELKFPADAGDNSATTASMVEITDVVQKNWIKR
ncbi:MAG: hypothetical protein O3C21_12740 [Verrucomicrobia bacterium]|nr:hypothetical protein [Verrucomicrobiota bacterium]